MKFKVGDKVRVVKCAFHTPWHEGVKTIFVANNIVGYEVKNNGCIASKLELIKPKVKKRVMRTKATITRIETTKRDNGWTLCVSYSSGAMKMFIAKDLGKFITKLTK